MNNVCVAIAVDTGHVVIPIRSIVIIQDMSDTETYVTDDTQEGRAMCQTPERAKDLCYRINRILDNHAAAGNFPKET